VRRERIVVPPHFLDRRIHFAHGLAECRKGILQAIWREGQASSAGRPNTLAATDSLACVEWRQLGLRIWLDFSRRKLP